jgi:hypothetical protein
MLRGCAAAIDAKSVNSMLAAITGTNLLLIGIDSWQCRFGPFAGRVRTGLHATRIWRSNRTS